MSAQRKNADLSSFGSRLRAVRKQLGIGQAEFGTLGGVVGNSQSRYETGATEPAVGYLAALAKNGIDVLWIITGVHCGGNLSLEQSELLGAFTDLGPVDRGVALRLVDALAGRQRPAAVLGLPSPRALAAAFGALLEASPGLDGDDLAHELARRLPIILRAAEDEIPEPSTEQHDTFPAAPAIRDADRPVVRRERRSR